LILVEHHKTKTLRGVPESKAAPAAAAPAPPSAAPAPPEPAPAPIPSRLLYPREETAVLLGGVCTMTIIRLERKGLLTPVRLWSSKNSRVYHRDEEVRALVQARATDARGQP
jgi:hypothetical protein